ncbi:MAG: hydrogenase iron-sulfur subunit [Archaeoglobaceae archaeon]
MGKVGVFICTGCEIEKINIERLKEVAKEFGIEAKVHPFLCSAEGVEIIKKDLANLDAVVIAACSPRVKTAVFNFDGKYVERVNLREGVVWSHEINVHTQELAEDYLRMGIVKAQKAEKPEAYKIETSKDILVVGGGVAGLTAAIEIAKSGYKAILVEKEAQLGGFAAKLYKSLPTSPPYTKLEEPIVGKLIEEVKNLGVQIFTSTIIESIRGQPGAFDVKLNQNGKVFDLKVGAIIVATGWKPYDASKIENLGYGKFKNVVTNVEFESIAKNGIGKKDVVFIQCAGQRDEKHLPYCSTVCCLVSLKQAKYVTEKGGNAFIIYKDMRTPGLWEEFYKTMQDDPRIFLTRGEVKAVKEKGDKVLVEVTNTLLGEDVEILADLVVLATGMESTLKGLYTVKEEFPDEKTVPYKHIYEPKLIKSAEEVEEIKKIGHILNLAYRQGPELPTLRYGFPDSNYICFPYESRRVGIYACGAVRAPMEISAAMEDARGAALKAIQAVELVSEGKTTFPRTGDIDYPNFFLQRCTQCKRCTEECPFGALDEDERGTPMPNPLRCRRCGICFGACPEKIISFKQYSVDQISSAIKAIYVPDPNWDESAAEKFRILAFVCENDALPALDMAALNGIKINPLVRFIPVRCLGSVNTVFIADALSKGIDGILLIGCKFGQDYQCHFIRGSELANRRMENVQETLQRLMLEKERVKVFEVSINDWDKIVEIVNGFVEEIKQIGPNPYKGF